MAFRCESSPLQEMQRMEALRARDPQSAAAAVANGKLLVEWARDGRLRELQCALEHLDGETRVLLFYAVRMFRVACHARRLDVLRFMLANGFDLQQACMRDVLHGVVEAIDDEAAADAAQPLVRFLLDAGVDVNWQRKGDLRTALHIACAKNLYGVAYLLILYDADVNAIAADDEMPLGSAERMALLGRAVTEVDREQNRQLLALLNDCGARRSWRKVPRAPATSARGSNADHGSAMAHTAPAPGRRILSFSASTTLLQASCPVVQEQEDGTLAQAFAEGIQLDTPATPW